MDEFLNMPGNSTNVSTPINNQSLTLNPLPLNPDPLNNPSGMSFTESNTWAPYPDIHDFVTNAQI